MHAGIRRESTSLVGGLLIDAQLTGAGQDRVLKLCCRTVGNLSAGPAVTGPHFPEHRNPEAIGAELAIKDVDIQLESFFGAFARGIPVGDDHPAKRIGRGDRHEGNRIQRGAPQEGIDANPGTATDTTALAAIIATEKRQAIGTEQAALRPLETRAVIG